MSEENTKKYHAFISYRHADNKQEGRQWATWLHQALETYEVPSDLVGTENPRGEEITARIFPIFRDEAELPADADLSNAITRALDSTKTLIVLCSPRAVESKYVAEEIDYFKKLGYSDRIIAAIIDGEPNCSWDEGKQKSSFNAEQECFPIPLQFAYENNQATTKRAEPIAADFRIINKGIPCQGWTSPEAYRLQLKAEEFSKTDIEGKVSKYQTQHHLMFLKIVAGILGVPLGELTQRDKAYQLEKAQQRAKKLRKVAAIMLVLLILAVFAGIIAWNQKQTADAQRLIAEKNEILADKRRIQIQKQLAKLYLERADGYFDSSTNRNDGLPWVIEALKTDPDLTKTPSLWLQLRKSYGHANLPSKVVSVGSKRLFHKSSDDERFLAMASTDWNYTIYDIFNNETVVPKHQFPEKPLGGLFLTEDKSFLIYGNSNFIINSLESNGTVIAHTDLKDHHPWVKNNEKYLDYLRIIDAIESPNGDILFLIDGAKLSVYKDEEIFPTHIISFNPKTSKTELFWKYESETQDTTAYGELLVSDNNGFILEVYTSEGRDIIPLPWDNSGKRFATATSQNISLIGGIVDYWKLANDGGIIVGHQPNDLVPETISFIYYASSNQTGNIINTEEVQNELSVDIKGLDIREARRYDDLLAILYEYTINHYTHGFFVATFNLSKDGIEFLQISEEFNQTKGGRAANLNRGGRAATLNPDIPQLVVSEFENNKTNTYSINEDGSIKFNSEQTLTIDKDLTGKTYYSKDKFLNIHSNDTFYRWSDGTLKGPFLSMQGEIILAPENSQWIASMGSGKIEIYDKHSSSKQILGKQYQKTDLSILDLKVENNGVIAHIGSTKNSSELEDITSEIRINYSNQITPITTQLDGFSPDSDSIKFIDNSSNLLLKKKYGQQWVYPVDQSNRKTKEPVPFLALQSNGSLGLDLYNEKRNYNVESGSFDYSFNVKAFSVEDPTKIIWDKEFNSSRHHFKLIHSFHSPEFALIDNEYKIIELLNWNDGEKVAEFDMEVLNIDHYYYSTPYLISSKLAVFKPGYGSEDYKFVNPVEGEAIDIKIPNGGSYDFVHAINENEVFILSSNEDNDTHILHKLIYQGSAWEHEQYPLLAKWTKVFFHPSKKIAFIEESQNYKNNIRLWDLEKLKPLSINLTYGEFKLSNVEEVIWSKQSDQAFIRTKSASFVYRTTDGKLISRLHDHPELVLQADGSYHLNAIKTMAISQNEQWFATGDKMGEIKISKLDSSPIPMAELKRINAIFSNKVVDSTGELIPINWEKFADEYNAR